MEYYNAKMKTILTSHNFCFLQPFQTNPPEHLIIQPDQVEGEPTIDTLDKFMPEMSDRNVRNESITSQDEGVDLPVMERKSTYLNCGRQEVRELIIVNSMTSYLKSMTILKFHQISYVYALITGDKLTSLKDAQWSPEWPQWQKVIDTELH